MELAQEEIEVLTELRERSDGTHERESVSTQDFPGTLLRKMALRGLVRCTMFTGETKVLHAHITSDGISALLSHESAKGA
jgi:hypothetical protein